jgi:hypothetical protein
MVQYIKDGKVIRREKPADARARALDFLKKYFVKLPS